MPIEQKSIPTISEGLFNSLLKLREGLFKILKESQIIDRGFNRPGDDFVVIGPQFDWAPLQGHTLVLQRTLQKEWARLKELLEFLSLDMPESVKDIIGDAISTIDSFLKQEELLWSDSKSQLEEEAAKAFITIISGLNNFSSSPAKLIILVPDTNALLTQPELREYYIVEHKVELVLVPAVISELDKMKIHHNENVRNKAKKIDRAIKELRRRNNILDGTTVVKDKIVLKALAVEPRMASTLEWLDPKNLDDRILASTLEIMRHNIGTPIAIVTRDLNLQTKASLARITYVEPPKSSN